VEELPLDVVLLSHTHYDHLDLPTARRIGNSALWLVPLGVGELLAAEGISNYKELSWGDSHHLMSRQGVPVEVVFLPAKHWTSRNLMDRNRCLWGSFAVLSETAKFFFAGDTAYSEIFKDIGEQYGPFDMGKIIT
jgi:L-ascorbate metabolism protein UlaG (beta-lactamase superfamily)